MSDLHRHGSSEAAATLRALRWPLLALALGLLVAVVAIRACRTVERGQDATASAVGRAGEALGDIAERFRAGSITTTFISAVPHLIAGEGPRLELVAFEATEVFTRSDDRRVLFDLVPLGTTVSQIRVPVTYRYHLRLDDPWRLKVAGQTVVVRAPRIRPTVPPAIHTDRMEKLSSAAWLRFDATEQMELLERSLTPTLSERAADPARIDLVREQCRRRVAELIRAWLEAEDHWRADRFRAITVVFADEAVPTAAAELPTLTLPDLQ